MSEPTERVDGTADRSEDRRAWQFIEQALRGLRYGTVTVTVQDGVVVQVERTEKTRLRRGGSGHS